MLTVPEAARRSGKHPETIRRWIRSGRLRSHKIGTQHLIEDDDLSAALASGATAPPETWETTWTGEPMPDWVTIIRQLRDTR